MGEGSFQTQKHDDFFWLAKSEKENPKNPALPAGEQPINYVFAFEPKRNNLPPFPRFKKTHTSPSPSPSQNNCVQKTSPRFSCTQFFFYQKKKSTPGTPRRRALLLAPSSPLRATARAGNVHTVWLFVFPGKEFWRVCVCFGWVERKRPN